MLSLLKGIKLDYYHNAQTIAEAQKPWEQLVDIEKTRGRTTCRIMKVFRTYPTKVKNVIMYFSDRLSYTEYGWKI